MPLNITVESDSGGEDYEIIGSPSSRPSSWETHYEDEYIGPPPRPRMRASSRSFGSSGGGVHRRSRNHRKSAEELQRDEEHLKQQIREIERDLAAVSTGSPPARPVRTGSHRTRRSPPIETDYGYSDGEDDEEVARRVRAEMDRLNLEDRRPPPKQRYKQHSYHRSYDARPERHEYVESPRVYSNPYKEPPVYESYPQPTRPPVVIEQNYPSRRTSPPYAYSSPVPVEVEPASTRSPRRRHHASYYAQDEDQYAHRSRYRSSYTNAGANPIHHDRNPYTNVAANPIHHELPTMEPHYVGYQYPEAFPEKPVRYKKHRSPERHYYPDTEPIFEEIPRGSPDLFNYPDPRIHSSPPPDPYGVRAVSRTEQTRSAASGSPRKYRATPPLPTPVKLRDPQGRVYSFPYTQCKKWGDFNDLVKGACGYLEDIGPCVMGGMYELIGPDGTAVHQYEWEELMRPGWTLSLNVKEFGSWRENNAF